MYSNNDLRKLNEYPNTLGKRSAMKYFNWVNLGKVEEVLMAPRVLNLAELIDAEHKWG